MQKRAYLGVSRGMSRPPLTHRLGQVLYVGYTPILRDRYVLMCPTYNTKSAETTDDLRYIIASGGYLTCYINLVWSGLSTQYTCLRYPLLNN